MSESFISLVWFYGISTIVGYLMPNFVYTYTLNIQGSLNKFPDIFRKGTFIESCHVISRRDDRGKINTILPCLN